MDFNRCAKIVQTEGSTKAENNVFKLFTSAVLNVIPHLMRDPADTNKTKAWIPAQGRDDKWITIGHSVLTIHH
ncbi:hypothetical protein [Mediterranea massiliensis]|uniref:hypothetical protein n=1 Tax=Mediterranea massiliensis TaxID=1841865 RepID=UPI00093361C0|nr:hypothetical protein [Mediterranea massiliensis]